MKSKKNLTIMTFMSLWTAMSLMVGSLAHATMVGGGIGYIPAEKMMGLNWAASHEAREQTDRLIDFAIKKNGVGLLSSQKVDAFDIFYARAFFAHASKVYSENNHVPAQVLWLKAPSHSGISQLLKWISEMSGAPYLTSTKENSLSGEVGAILKDHPLVILDGAFVTEDPSYLSLSMYFMKTGSPEGSEIIFVDQVGMYEKLTVDAHERITVVDLTSNHSCNESLAPHLH